MPMTAEKIAAGSKWTDEAAAFAPGTRLERVRVLAFAEGYVMARRTGCAPFVMPVKDFLRRFAPAARRALSTEETK